MNEWHYGIVTECPITGEILVVTLYEKPPGINDWESLQIEMEEQFRFYSNSFRLREATPDEVAAAITGIV